MTDEQRIAELWDAMLDALMDIADAEVDHG